MAPELFLVPLLWSSEESSEMLTLASAAAALLTAQWPRAWEPVIRRSGVGAAAALHVVAVCAVSGEVLAHASLRDAADSASGSLGGMAAGGSRRALLHGLVVTPAARGRGIGAATLASVEHLARALGYDAMILSTLHASGFYRACGYRALAEGAAAAAPVLVGRGAAAAGIEAMLMQQRRRQRAEPAAAFTAAYAAATENSTSAAFAEEEELEASGVSQEARSAWFAKRLRDFAPIEEAVRVAWSCRGADGADGAVVIGGSPRQICAAGVVARLGRPHGGGVFVPTRCFRQLGPSCGLTALLMAAESTAPAETVAATVADGGCDFGGACNCWRANGSPACAPLTAEAVRTAAAAASLPPVPQSASASPVPLRDSLLREALRRGVSSDGEMFSLPSLLALAREVANMPRASRLPLALDSDGRIGTTNNNSTADVDVQCEASVERALAAGALLLIAYDADGGWAPIAVGGARAHWAVLCGLLRSSSAEPSAPATAILVHSMSRMPLAVDLRALLASNAQLRAADGERVRANGWVVGDADGAADLTGAIVLPQGRPGPPPSPPPLSTAVASTA